MARQSSTTKLQISGYRLLVHRMEHALVRGDVRMLDDPLRAQSLSLIGGCILATIVVAACAILAFLSPRGAMGSDPIVMDRASGALYVRIGDTVHPVPNLASARLITGSAERPKLVNASAIEGAERGPLVGIPGAPESIATPLSHDESGWTVCEDSSATTTVIAGRTSAGLVAGRSVLVTAREESAASTYLLYDGRRARVDLRDNAAVRALRLEGVVPRPVSRSLLDAVPETPEITAPHIPQAGMPSMLRGFPIGAAVRVSLAGFDEYYVVVAGGLQRVGELTADLISFSHSRGLREMPTVEPGLVGTAPIRDDLHVSTFPERGGVVEDPVLCTQWIRDRSGHVKTAVLSGDSLPISDEDTPVKLAQADEGGNDVDAVLMPRGRGAFVRAAGVTGDSAAKGSMYVVSDSGVVFGVHDEDAAKRLGLGDAPVPAPWPVLARLPRGPELSVHGASLVRSSIGAAP